MNRTEGKGGYQGGYLIGFIIIAAVALRTAIFYQGQVSLVWVISLLAVYGLLYVLEPWLSLRFRWYRFLYFPLQTCTVIALTNLRPFTDVSSLLYVPLCIQVMRAFSRRVAMVWLIFYVALLTLNLMLGLGWLEGLALVLLFLAVCAFLVSFDLLYLRTQADQAESQNFLADLQSAHQKLQDYAVQVKELSATRERNRLARELHDSVSQVIFGITLTSQSARLLLEHDPARVPEQIDRLQEMTSSALSQLRSLISELRPR
jgi:signal transduction histidine kinase